MPKLLVRSAVAVRCESSRGRLRPRLFNLLDFRPCENRELFALHRFFVVLNFVQRGFLLAFSPASLTFPFIFDFGVKIARTLCVFCTVLISVGHLPYPRGFSTKNGERLCVSVSFTEGCAAVVACLLRLKSTLHGVPFAPFSVGVGCLPCPELSFSKSLTQGLLFEPDIQFSIFACSFGYSRKEKY